MTSILLVDDHTMVRSGLKHLLEQSNDITVIAEAGDGKQAIQEASKTNPDVIVLDISMPDMDGLEACKSIMAVKPSARILVLTMHSEEIYAVRMLKAGALGYITKMASADELYRAIRSVANGKPYLSETAAGSVVLQLMHLKGHSNQLDLLSDREVQVLNLIVQGKKSSDIATTLRISSSTVQNYRSRILHKLGLNCNAELIEYAHQNGFLAS
jgi:DNA-binding NarL/FixJ family response regulator